MSKPPFDEMADQLSAWPLPAILTPDGRVLFDGRKDKTTPAHEAPDEPSDSSEPK